MSKTDIKDEIAVDERDSPMDERREPSGKPEGKRPAAREPGGSPLRLYKPGQGVRVRWGTAIGAGVLSLWGASYLFDQLGRFAFFSDSLALHYLIPVVVLAAIGVGVFYLVGQNPRVVDFLVATESEIKKVNWSTRREVIGATRVVIVTVLALGFLLFLVNLVFIILFERIGVLRTNMSGQILSRLMGGGEG
jgi:preprotein translocase SecE subunit